MVVTTASKLMLAQDEVEDLKNELAEAKVNIDKLNEEIEDLKYNLEEAEVELSHINNLYMALKYKNKPWWKFW